jgi:deoxyribonuclease V
MRALHGWNLTPTEAIALQQRLRGRIELADRYGTIRNVAGVDVGFERDGAVTRAAVVVLSFPGLLPLDQALARQPTRFPYVPGLLSFREIPAILAALKKLKIRPDLLLVDGHGLAHPRRFGIACHLGLYADIPAIGVAKSLLVGEHGPVPRARGRWTPLVAAGETIGGVLRSRAGVKPVYVSPGHRVSLERAVEFAMACVKRYRLPETTRCAHGLASHGRLPRPG